MPTTFTTFVIASLALAGIFPLAGFWSKDEILANAGHNGYTAFMIVGIVGAAMTAAYMTRCVWLTFFGEYRGHGHPHESPRLITVPLVILTVMAVGAGWLNAFGYHGFAEWTENDVVTAAMQSAHATEAKFNWPVALISIGVAVIAIVVTFAYYELHAFGAGPRAHPEVPAGPGRLRASWKTSTTSTSSTPMASSAPSRARSPGPATGSTRTSSTAVVNGVAIGTRYTARLRLQLHRPGRDRRRRQRGRGRR